LRRTIDPRFKRARKLREAEVVVQALEFTIVAETEIKKATDWEEVDRILEELKDEDVYTQIRALRGKIHFTVPLDELREDRD
jgi:hypothetical protein